MLPATMTAILSAISGLRDQLNQGEDLRMDTPLRMSSSRALRVWPGCCTIPDSSNCWPNSKPIGAARSAT